ncbi:hypothetical protein ACJMK2_030716 [Sinanodonta woodiana]|uniref:Uncharacterized protein n=1 Tax=Sinanodonta woodiana TaxID=1069815 RepID=A0ABD3WWK0_SINWO
MRCDNNNNTLIRHPIKAQYLEDGDLTGALEPENFEADKRYFISSWDPRDDWLRRETNNNLDTTLVSLIKRGNGPFLRWSRLKQVTPYYSFEDGINYGRTYFYPSRDLELYGSDLTGQPRRTSKVDRLKPYTRYV